jgi:hypothetical protein
MEKLRSHKNLVVKPKKDNLSKLLGVVFLIIVIAVTYLGKDKSKNDQEISDFESKKEQQIPVSSGNSKLTQQNDLEINQDFAENQLKSFNSAIMANSDQDLSDLLSDAGILEYMKLKNISKQDVVTDKSIYARRWRLSEVTYNDFKRKSKSEFTYILKSRLSKTENPTLEKVFLINGTIGFDAEGKINKIVDNKTVYLNPESSKSITDMYEILGSTWVFKGSGTMDLYYATYLPDGKLEFDMLKDDNLYWTIENGQLVFGKKGFSTITCSILDGNLSCEGSNNSDVNWNLIGYRKK